MIQPVNTGERILLEKETPLMIARHLSAYQFAKGYVGGKTVLDIGCGEGYGSHFLSGYSRQVIGIDYNASVIEYAREKYQGANLEFSKVDIKDLAVLNNKFEVVCCFQVIEHLIDTDSFLQNIKSTLTGDGVFICSTCNKLDSSPNSSAPLNKFHVKEYLLDEYIKLLRGYFGTVEVYGLRRSRKLNFYRRLKKIGLFNFLPASFDPVKRFYRYVDYRGFVIVKNDLATALDFIAVCRK